MALLSHLYVGCLIFSTTLHFTRAISCVKCQGTQDECGMPVVNKEPKRYKEICYEGYDQCMKTVRMQDGRESYLRFCADDLICSDALRACQKSRHSTKCYVYCCFENMCNTAVKSSSALYLMTACLLFALVHWFVAT